MQNRQHCEHLCRFTQIYANEGPWHCCDWQLHILSHLKFRKPAPRLSNLCKSHAHLLRSVQTCKFIVLPYGIILGLWMTAAYTVLPDNPQIHTNLCRTGNLMFYANACKFTLWHHLRVMGDSCSEDGCQGRWDLAGCMQVHMQISNMMSSPPLWLSDGLGSGTLAHPHELYQFTQMSSNSCK